MTTSQLTSHEQNLIWIDLEMTGLYPDRDRIIELAVVVTDANLEQRVAGPVFAVHQSDGHARRHGRLEQEAPTAKAV